MNKFIEIPASKKSLSKRKLVQGVGVNDANYRVMTIIDGKRFHCPIYMAWRNMIARCYCKKYQSIYQTYVGCSVSDEWLTFSNFRLWMMGQEWEGKQVDKDIVKSSNKVYGATTCLLVSSHINSILPPKKTVGKTAFVGVHRSRNRFTAYCRVGGKNVRLGTFIAPEEAHEAYLAFKSKHVLEVAQKQDEPLKGYLTRISKEIASGEYFR